jgi:hypothetical protein
VPPSPKDSPCAPLRACARGACGRVSGDVVVVDVSNITTSVRVALCPSCLSAQRTDPLTIVEEAT